MKKLILCVALIICTSLLVTSCYTHQYSVGKGAQKGIEVTEKNHYLIYELAPISTSDPTKMADGASDYDVKHQWTFVDGFLMAITGGIYTPTTTTVTK